MKGFVATKYWNLILGDGHHRQGFFKTYHQAQTAFETHVSGGAIRTSYSHFKPLTQHNLQSRTETQKNQSRGTDLIKY